MMISSWVINNITHHLFWIPGVLQIIDAVRDYFPHSLSFLGVDPTPGSGESVDTCESRFLLLLSSLYMSDQIKVLVKRDSAKFC